MINSNIHPTNRYTTQLPGGGRTRFSVGTSLFQIVCCNSKTIQRRFLDPETHANFEEVKDTCATIEYEIRVRCAGLLEIRLPHAVVQDRTEKNGRFYEHVGDRGKSVEFVHRTARDFLSSTRGGQDIMSYNKSSSMEMGHSLLRAEMCQMRLLQEKRLCFPSIWHFLLRLDHVLASDKDV